MERIYKGRLLLTCLLLAFFMIIPQVSAANLRSPEELEAFFDGAVAMQMREYKLAGATVALVRGGEIVFSKGYGMANLEKQVPMDPETTLHRPGSNSKILVWTAVMQLIEAGRLDLFTDINAYLDFAIPSKVAGREAPPITLHHLMTHSAGFEDRVIELFVSSADLMQPLNEYVKNHLPSRVFQPGSVMAYSNYGTTLAAYIVEVVSGQPFSEYAEEHILAPLRMNSSTFEQPLSANLASQMSEGYRYEDGGFVPGGFEYVQSYPAGALTSTTHDMARLIMAHLDLAQPEASPEGEIAEDEAEAAAEEEEEELGEEGERLPDTRILQKETAQIMQTQQFSVHPEMPGMTYGFIEADYNGHRVLSHGGDTLLFTTGLYFLPVENLGLYIVYNSPLGEQARLALWQGFMDRYFPDENPGQATPQSIAAGMEKNYTGTYHTARSNFTSLESVLRLAQPMALSVDEEGYLNVRVSGVTTRYGEIAPNLFQNLSGSDKMVLSFDDGRVTKVHFDGPSTWLRTPWYQTPTFLLSLLGISVLFMLVTILGWIRAIFRPQARRSHFVAPKVLGVLFFLLFVTTLILFADIMGTIHPTLGVPTVVLEPSSTLNAVLVLTKILVGLAGLILLTDIYLIITRRGNRLQRLYYTLLTLSSLSVIAVMYQIRLF
ncbi:MAG: beta-lactamase family protein [Limnochordia bacterium]|jgi:CubicO group peptidase (beta-lactamase class C family)|nr:beta-lactamase family protein [Limnochordia bacterium]